MKRIFICFIFFVITGIGSAFLGVPGNATFVVGGVCALLYLICSRKKSNKNTSSSSSSSNSYSSSNSRVYSTKKYSLNEVSRLLSSGNLYACRFKDNSNMTRIDAVTRAKIYIYNETEYIEIPERLGGKYKLLHGYSHSLKGGCMYMNEGGDSWYLMDQNKNIILY